MDSRTRKLALAVVCGAVLVAVIALQMPQKGPEAPVEGVAVSQLAAGTVSPAELRKILAERRDVLLLDVRQPGEFEEGHIEGAVLMPVDDLPNRLSEIQRDKDIFIYCQSGRRASQAASVLREQGYPSVVSMTGGFNDWVQLLASEAPEDMGEAVAPDAANGGEASVEGQATEAPVDLNGEATVPASEAGSVATPAVSDDVPVAPEAVEPAAPEAVAPVVPEAAVQPAAPVVAPEEKTQD